MGTPGVMRLGTLRGPWGHSGDIGALLRDGPTGGTRDLRVAERCREAVGDIPKLLQG